MLNKYNQTQIYVLQMKTLPACKLLQVPFRKKIGPCKTAPRCLTLSLSLKYSVSVTRRGRFRCLGLYFGWKNLENSLHSGWFQDDVLPIFNLSVFCKFPKLADFQNGASSDKNENVLLENKGLYIKQISDCR